MDDYQNSDLFLDHNSDYDDARPPISRAPALDAQQRIALVAAIDAGLRDDGCDNTLRAAERWARSAGVRWPPLRSQLEDDGGFCDCEVLLNVLGEEPEPD